MKKLLLLLIALCAAGVVFFACMGGEEAPEPAVPTETPSGEQSTPEPEQEPSGVDYAAIYALHEPEEIVMTVDGRDMTPENMLFIMDEGGNGLANDNGVTENNEFTWSVSGDQLTITPRSGTHFVYTVNDLSATECTFSGTNVPMADIPSNVVVHLVRVR